MKMQRKISISLMITLSLLLCMVNVYAAGASISAQNVTAKPDETVTVAVNVSENPGIMYLKMNFTYDADKLEFVKAEKGSVSMSSFTSTSNSLSWDDDKDVTETGSLATLTFTVKSSATGQASIGLSVVECANYDEQDVAVSVSGGSITIQEKEHEHKWDAGKVSKIATCKEEGVREQTCTVCGEKKTETIAKDASNHANYGTELKNAKAATETSKGYTGDKVCKGCGAVLEKGKDIEPLGHKHKLIKTDAKAPTCTEKGNIEYYTCSSCKKVFGDAAGTKEITDVTVPAKGHQYGEWKVEKEATKTAEGLKIRVCKVCGNKQEQKIAPLSEPTTSGQKIYDIGDNNNGYAYINGGKCDDNNKPAEKNKPTEKCDEPTTAGKTPANVDSTAKTGARIVKTDGGKSTGDSSIFVIVTGIVAVAGAAFAVTKKKKF